MTDINTWQTLGTVATGDLFRASDIQKWWLDAEYLKSPETAEVRGPGPNNTYAVITPTGVWTDIDANYYRVTFESGGNPVLIWVTFQYSHSVANGNIWLAVTVDGIRYGNSGGLGLYINAVSGPNGGQLAYIASLTAGEHEVIVQANNQTAGDARLWLDYPARLWIWEF